MIRLTRIEVLEVDCSCRHRSDAIGSTAVLVPHTDQSELVLTRQQGALRALVADVAVPILVELLWVITTCICYIVAWAAQLASDTAQLASENLFHAARSLRSRSCLLSRDDESTAITRGELEP